MCGIVGQARGGEDAVDPALIRHMCARIVHRGPDDEGIYAAGRVGLGMRRLSIIDVSGGQQPIFNETRQVVTVCNGEIYNFQSLRLELKARGHRFSSGSDVETIVHLYEESGVGMLDRLSGMFGLAIWDEARQLMLLAVDRMGKKPLYYHLGHDGTLTFGSELKALLAADSVPRDVDPAALELFLALGYIPAPYTVYRGIGKLAPGHRLVWQGGRIHIEPYWRMPQPPAQPRPVAEEEALERVSALLRGAVQRRLMAEVPLGAFLSGGVDSSIVVALMCELSSAPPKTFCIGFEDQSFSEVEHARAVARHLGTDHHEEIVTARAAQDLPMLAAHFDEPFADASAVPTYYLSRMTRKAVTVALSGDGGDEVFGGYRTYTAMRAMQWLDYVPRWLRRVALYPTMLVPESTSFTSLGRRIRRVRDLAATVTSAQRYSALHNQWPVESRRALIGAATSLGRDVVGDRFAEVGDVDAVRAAMWVDSTLYMPGDILVKVDRMSMLNSLEVRCPFLDAELIEYVAALPVGLKVRGMTTKYLLKRLAASKLPPGIVDRPKHGFGVPVGRWLREDLRDLFADALLGPDSRVRQWVDQTVLREHWMQHLSGRRDNTNELWSVLILELWLRSLTRD